MPTAIAPCFSPATDRRPSRASFSRCLRSTIFSLMTDIDMDSALSLFETFAALEAETWAFQLQDEVDLRERCWSASWLPSAKSFRGT